MAIAAWSEFAWLPLRLSSDFQVRWHFVARRGCQKFAHFNRQRASKLLQHINTGVFREALHPANIGSIDPGIDGESLLRKAPFNPQPAEIYRQYLSCIHRTTRPFGGPLNHWLSPSY